MKLFQASDKMMAQRRRKTNYSYFWKSLIFIPLVIVSFLSGKSYPVKTLMIEDGLPQSSINIIFQDSDGFLWLGTRGGLVKYDGVNVTSYSQAEGYPFFLITGIAEPEPGTIWLGCDIEGLWEIKNNQVRPIIFDEERPKSRVLFLKYFNNETLLIGAQPGGLYIIKDGKTRRIGTEQGLISNEIISGAIDHDGNIWIGTSRDGTQKFTDYKPALLLHKKDGFPGEYVSSIFPAANGEIWFGTDNGLYILGPNGSRTLLRDTPQPTVVFDIFQENEDNIWLSTTYSGGGLIRVTNDSIAEIIGINDGLPSNSVKRTYIDQYGNMFIGTFNGMGIITEREFENYGKYSGINDPYITAICETDDKTIWIGTKSDGLYKINKDKFESFCLSEDMATPYILYLTSLKNQVWCGTTTGLQIIEDGKLTATPLTAITDNAIVRQITFVEENHILVTTSAKLYRQNDGTISDITYNVTGSFWGMNIDKNGDIILATDGNGIWRLKNDIWVSLIDPDSSFASKYYGMRKGNDGTLYFPSSKGAYSWNGNRFTRLLGQEHTVWDILPSSRDGLWFGTSRGLYRYSNKQWSFYNKKSGLINNEFNISSFYEDSDHNLWFGGMNGIVKYTRQKPRKTKEYPDIFITGVVYNDQSLSSLTDLVFPPGKHTLEIHYTGLDYKNPEKIRFRYKLNGLDKDWRPPTGDRSVTYNYLPHGDYQFIVQAKGASGIWSKTFAALSFTISTPWYKTWWVWAVYIFIGYSIIYGIFTYRIRYLKLRTELLEHTVTERTQDLQSEISKHIATTEKLKESNAALGESNSMKDLLLDVITHDLKNPAGVISGMSEILMEELPDNEIVPVIHESSKTLLTVIDHATTLSKISVGDTLQKEPLDFAALISEAIAGFQLAINNVHMTVENNLPETLYVKANPIIIEVFRNYISNAIKYASDGGKIIIDYEMDDEFVTINIRDLGKTVEKKFRKSIFSRNVQLSKKKRHGRGLGLAIVKRIAENHNAIVGMKPNKPKGNCFFLKYPL